MLVVPGQLGLAGPGAGMWVLRDPLSGPGTPAEHPESRENVKSMAGTENGKQPTSVPAVVNPALNPKVEAQLLWVDP